MKENKIAPNCLESRVVVAAQSHITTSEAGVIIQQPISAQYQPTSHMANDACMRSAFPDLQGVALDPTSRDRT